jgi:DegV family protein with EDD domain
MVKIISDSTCDLSKDLLARYDISVLPLHILLGDKEYEDGVDITPDEIYQWSDEHRMTPKTSAESIERAMELMHPFLEQGYELVCFSVSEEMSTSANVMRLAAEELEAKDRVYVIDSKNLSTGVGHLVIEAAIMAEEGKSGAEITAQIEKLRPSIRASFVVDTLIYLHRGGRCSGLSALVGGALKLHPMIIVSDGRMSVSKKYRGHMKKVILSYVKDMESDLRQARKDRVFITHSGCERAIIDAVRDYLESLDHFDEILETRAGGVISCHCGPGTLGVLYITEKES